MAPIGPTLHDIPFSTSRASSSTASSPSSPHGGSSNRHSGSWQASSRPSSHYDRSAAYPPPRGSHHPSLSHSTSSHHIPTPAQSLQSYSAYGASASAIAAPVVPVIAAIPPASSSSPPQERFYCERCDKSFGRAHDKKRHVESTHMQQSHMCRFCNKTFSRNDSLKRHQDNGCEKEPELNP